MPIRGDRLREIRTQHQLSQRDLAKRCGLGEKAIFRYENNQADPSADYLVRIARELAISTDYLLGLSDSVRGQFGDGALNDDELMLVEAYRRGGWLGASRLSTEKLGEQINRTK